MAKIIITKDNLLTPAEFKALLEQTTERSSALEDVLGLLRELVSFVNGARATLLASAGWQPALPFHSSWWAFAHEVSYEEEYDMGSDAFYARFMRGEMGDDIPFNMWAGQYESYLEAKQTIASRLNKVAARG